MSQDIDNNEEWHNTALGGVIAGVGTSAAIAERARQLSNATGLSYGDALIELGNSMRRDAVGAFNVVRGSTPFDVQESQLGADDHSYGSMRAYAQAQSPNSAYTTSSRNGFIGNPLTQAAIAARDAFSASSEDLLGFKREERLRRGVSPEGPKSDTVLSRIPLLDAARDLLPERLGGFSDLERKHRAQEGIGLMRGNAWQTAGGVTGRAVSDFVNNGARNVWWLLNAPQAVVDVGAELVTGISNREGLYGLDYALEDTARNQGWIDRNTKQPVGNVNQVRFNMNEFAQNDPHLQQKVEELRAKGQTGDRLFSRRRVNNNLSTALAFPAAVAINSGLGLTSLNGNDGRYAVFPSEDDPTKTENAVAEVAAKYFLGRSGDLLPFEEFRKVRPDVTADEYRAYKAYRYGKEEDWNIFDDGDINILNGVIKASDDGLEGPEIMFLGRGMPVATTLVPTAAGIAGAAIGAGLSKYGGLNIDGVKGGIERRKVERQTLDNELMNMPIKEDNKADRAFKTKQSEKLSREIDQKKKQLEAMETGFASPFFRNKRIRNASVITGGLAGGALATGVTSVIANELERRRREEEAALGI